MEPVIDSAFWRGETPVILASDPPLASWAQEQTALRGHVLFRTSGSTGVAKHVCLSKAALQASAEAVNAHLEATQRDRWLLALPTSHVGGFGVLVRAALSDSVWVRLEGRWDPERFEHLARAQSTTLTALVPTQLYDLVRAKQRAPEHLRAVLIGGGHLSEHLEGEGRRLGWPILKTYGMTETASQVATQALGAGMGDPLRVLPGWETRRGPEGVLMVKGRALFSGYVREKEGRFVFDRPFDERGWYETSDRATVTDGCLVFHGRVDHGVKIKGELIQLMAVREPLEEAVRSCGGEGEDATIIARPHDRDEHALILVVSRGTDAKRIQEAYHARVAGLLRVKQWIEVPTIPRTALGKVDEPRLHRLVDALTAGDILS